MPRTPQQFEGIREEKKALIMSVGLELFAMHGYHGTTISSIAKTAGISKGLLYNYFESKDELIKQIIYAGLENIDKLMDPNKDGVLTRDELEFLLDRFFDMMAEDLPFWKLYFTLFVQAPVIKLVEGKLQEVIGNYLQLLARYFETQGSADPFTDALLFGSLLDGIGLNYITNPEIFPVEKIKKRILELYSK